MQSDNKARSAIPCHLAHYSVDYLKPRGGGSLMGDLCNAQLPWSGPWEPQPRLAVMVCEVSAAAASGEDSMEPGANLSQSVSGFVQCRFTFRASSSGYFTSFFLPITYQCIGSTERPARSPTGYSGQPMWSWLSRASQNS